MGLNLRYSPLEYSKGRGFDFGNGNIINVGNNCVHKTFYVDSNNGSDGNDGGGLNSATATIDRAVTMANSPEYALKNVDILVVGGVYYEAVEISRTGTGLDSTAMLWAGGGLNIGSIGRLRLIAVGDVFWTTAAASITTPTLSVGRPNVEIHNFRAIRSQTTATVTAGNWTTPIGGSSAHVGMPVVCFDGVYNNSNLLYGAAANCKIVNCLVNAGGNVRGGIMNLGCNWIDVINCQTEYGNEFGVAVIGSAKGSPAENVISGCRFQQNTNADILHGNNYMTWVTDCDFLSEPTKYLVRTGSGGGASAYCTIQDCTIVQPDLAELIDASNAGWQAINIHCTGGTTTHTLSNDLLTS